MCQIQAPVFIPTNMSIILVAEITIVVQRVDIFNFSPSALLLENNNEQTTYLILS
jgi:hypothetical protein